MTLNPGTGAATGKTCSSQITGEGSLAKTGGGECLFAGVNTYSGTTTVSAGKLTISADSALSANSALLVTAGTLNLVGSPTVLGVTQSGGTISGAGILTGTNYDLRAGTCSAVLAGTFRANNTTGSATGAGDVIVNSAGTLVGTGAISGAVAVNGTISPGVNLGTLSTGTQTWNSGGHYEWDLNDAAGTAGPNPGSQHRSNTGATPEQHARAALVAPWCQGRHTGFPPDLAGSQSGELDPALGGVRSPVFSVDEQAGRSDIALVVRML